MIRLLLVPLLFICLGCRHVQEENILAIRIIEKMPYATPPDVVIEMSHRW